MDTTRLKLTVLFDEPFYIGLLEREAEGKYSVAKITFGAEPKDYEVLAFILENWKRCAFSPVIEGGGVKEKPRNPKRMQREAQKAVESAGLGTKAQQALQLQREEGKLARREKTKEQREAEAERKFELRQEKRREKHRGR